MTFPCQCSRKLLSHRRSCPIRKSFMLTIFMLTIFQMPYTSYQTMFKGNDVPLRTKLTQTFWIHLKMSCILYICCQVISILLHMSIKDKNNIRKLDVPWRVTPKIMREKAGRWTQGKDDVQEIVSMTTSSRTACTASKSNLCRDEFSSIIFTICTSIIVQTVKITPAIPNSTWRSCWLFTVAHVPHQQFSILFSQLHQWCTK